MIAGFLLAGVIPALAAESETPAPAKTPIELIRELSKDPNGDLAALAKSLLGKSGGNALFYFPTPDTDKTPKSLGWNFDDISFESTEGTRLHGWFIPTTKKKSKGTIVFSHGNTGAMGYHLGFITWLIPEGFNVFMFDYRGFGSSTGKPDRRGMVDDVQAAFRYIKTRADVDKTRLISFGHSLGGAKSIASLGERPVAGVRAMISDAGFASYFEMAEWVAGKVGADIVTDELAPKDWVSKVSPTPLLIIHGTKDEIVPLEQGKTLFAAAAGPKTMFTVEGGRHGDSLWRNNGEYRKKTLAWLNGVLK
jgi:fermentation-respiration switch protein FrsA (DUF1100 family)